MYLSLSVSLSLDFYNLINVANHNENHCQVVPGRLFGTE